MPNSTTGGVSYEPGREPADWAGPGIPPEPVPEPPPARAPKSDHVEYAADALGVPAEDAEQMTKAELVELAQAGPTPDGPGTTPDPDSTPEPNSAASSDPADAPAPRPRPRPAKAE